MSDILDESPSIDTSAPRKHAWRQGPDAVDPDGDSGSDEESARIGVTEEFTGGDPRDVGPLVALALLIAAALIIALAVVTVNAGRGDAPRAEVAGVTETTAAPGPVSTTGAVASSSTVDDAATSVAVSPPSTVGRNPIELESGDLVLTTFYREVPRSGGQFSLAVRLENEGAVDFALADVEFLFDIGGDVIPAEELITAHGRVPAGGSAVVTIRVDLPAVVGTPELVVSAVNGELARAVLP